MAQTIISQLKQIDNATQDLPTQFITADDSRRENCAVQMAKYQGELERLQPQVVDYLANDSISNIDMNQLSTLYVDLQDRFDNFEQLMNNQFKSAPVKLDSLSPVRMSVQSATALNENVATLRQQLKEINRAVHDTSNTAENPYEDQQDQRELRDISVLAVSQLKQTTKIQNQNLQAEINSVRHQLEETVSENAQLKIVIAKLRGDFEMLVEENRSNALNSTKLFEERTSNKEDFDRLITDRERYRAKFENLRQLYDFEVKKNSQFRSEQYERLTGLEAEKAALMSQNAVMKQRVGELECCDMDSAAIEVARASQTIAYLTRNIEDLKQRMVEQKRSDADKIEALRATIVAFNDGELDENVEKAVLLQQLKEKDEINEQLSMQLTMAVEQSQIFQQQAAQRNSTVGQMNLATGAVPQGGARDGDILDIINRSRGAVRL